MIGTIDKIERYSKTYKTAEDLYANDRDYDAVMMNFVVLGEEVGKLTETLKEKYQNINWQKIYGLRNIIAHHYFGINVDLIWQILRNDLPQLKIDLNATNAT